MDSITRLINQVSTTKATVKQQQRQRRGGVTDLYGVDYTSDISSGGGSANNVNPSDGDISTVELRIKALTRALKAGVPNATAEGVSGIVGCFGLESNVIAKRYEADYATGYLYDKMKQEPTAENLMGSWSAFAALYNIPLNEAGYFVDGKHWIGVGLGQWTGTRCKALYDYCNTNNLDIWSFSGQIQFMLQENQANIVKEVAVMTDVTQATTKFLSDWEGVPGNKLAERIAFANKYIDVVREELNNPVSNAQDPNQTTNFAGEAVFRLTVSGDLDRFQRWFIKFIVRSKTQSNIEGIPLGLSDVHLFVSAQNETTGMTEDIDLTNIFRHKHPCNWIGDAFSGEGIFPNSKPLEGYDLMDCAWYLNSAQRDALFSPGEKVFKLRAVGEATITLRNFIKFSHIN